MATFQSHVFGLSMNIKNNLKSELNNAKAQWAGFTGGLTSQFEGVKAAMEGASESGMLTRGLLAVAGVMYTLQKAVSEGTSALVEQQLALNRASNEALRYGRNLGEVSGAIGRLGAAGGMLSQTGAAQSVGALLGARFNAAQAEEMTSALGRIAPLVKREGESLGQAMTGMAQSIAHGSAGALANFIPYIDQEMQKRHTSMADFQDALRWPIAQRALLDILRKNEQLAQQGYNAWAQTVDAARSMVAKTTADMSASFGRALEGMLIPMLHVVNTMLMWVNAFITAHPHIVQFMVLIVAATALLASLTLAYLGWEAAMARIAGSKAMISYIERTNPLLSSQSAKLFTSEMQLKAWGATARSVFLGAAAVIGVLAYAYKTNFMGIGDTIRSWLDGLGAVFDAVVAGIKSFDGVTYSWSQKIQDKLDEHGLLGVAQALMKGFFFLTQFIKGAMAGFDMFLRPVMFAFRVILSGIQLIIDAVSYWTNLLGLTEGGVDALTTVFKVLGFIAGAALALMVTNMVIAAFTAIPALVVGLWGAVTAAASLAASVLVAAAPFILIGVVVAAIAAAIWYAVAGMMKLVGLIPGLGGVGKAADWMLNKGGIHTGAYANTAPETAPATPVTSPEVAAAPDRYGATAPGYDAHHPLDALAKMFARETTKALKDSPPIMQANIDGRETTDAVANGMAQRNYRATGQMSVAPAGGQ